METGALVGRYVVVDRIGLQGWGTVYTAFDPELDRKVALKISPAPVADARDGDEPPDDARYRRLLREARVMAQINHPNAVAVHDVGEHDGRVFVTMEKVVGLTLDEWRLERPRTWSEVIEVFVAAGRGLAAAHDVGLVHRNFGPRSIVVAADGHVHVTDFGLARLSDRGSSVAEPGLELTADDGFATGVGARGAVDEALRYMAPERRHTADAAAADQFSFCVALYEALYREHPFGEQSVAEQQLRAAAGRLPSAPTERSVPERIRLAVLRGLS
ncbi:MAG: serine/threonine-protein kinase, partial [Myxococcota bacterium]